MSELKLKENQPKRIISASLVVAISIIGGTLLHSINSEHIVFIWLSTAVFMLGPLLATMLVWSSVKYDGWLFTTAVLLSMAIVIPWAFINPSVWATSYLPQLGLWGNVLFIVLLTSCVSAERPSKVINWLLTGFYLLIMMVMPFLL